MAEGRAFQGQVIDGIYFNEVIEDIRTQEEMFLEEQNLNPPKQPSMK